MTAMLGACGETEVRPHAPEDSAAVARGRQAAVDLGCGACHTMPGIGWPQGRAGPSLDGFAARAMIAGRLPSRPDVLAAYLRDPQALVPGTAMPAVPMTQGQADDMAAWLYTLDRDDER